MTNALIFCSYFFLTIHGGIGVKEAHTRPLDIFDANSILFYVDWQILNSDFCFKSVQSL